MEETFQLWLHLHSPLGTAIFSPEKGAAFDMETPLQEDWPKAEQGQPRQVNCTRKLMATSNQNKIKQSEAKAQTQNKTLSSAGFSTTKSLGTAFC